MNGLALRKSLPLVGRQQEDLAFQTQRTGCVDAGEDKLRSSSASFGKNGKTWERATLVQDFQA